MITPYFISMKHLNKLIKIILILSYSFKLGRLSDNFIKWTKKIWINLKLIQIPIKRTMRRPKNQLNKNWLKFIRIYWKLCIRYWFRSLLNKLLMNLCISSILWSIFMKKKIYVKIWVIKVFNLKWRILVSLMLTI